ncbi:hypothetical protein Tco_0927563 [Tanacetum coccineum]
MDGQLDCIQKQFDRAWKTTMHSANNRLKTQTAKDALLNVELLKTKDMVCMEVYNELSKRFLQLEKHCISLEISIQQKEESFHSNKPCKNKEYPEFHEFFVINDLKAQLQAKTTLICDLKNQIKSVKEASNEAKVKNDIDVIETINIELEHSVAKLLAANEQLHKEKEHLKQTYKELYDTIKKTRVQNKDNSDSLISQINQKSVENADLKAQIQEKIGIGQRFSLNKSSAVHEKPHTPRSCLRWKPTGRIFKTVSLRWIPTGKMFTDSTTKVDSEPQIVSNEISLTILCNQTLYLSADTMAEENIPAPEPTDTSAAWPRVYPESRI